MDSSSVCVRKLGWKWWRKTQRNHFYTLNKTFLLIENICSQISGENFLMKLEKLAQNSLKNLEENSTHTPKFIGLEKLAVGVCKNYRSTGRSTGQRSYFRPLSHRSIGRSTEARIQRASLSVRSAARSTGTFQRAELSGRSTGSVDRPYCQNLRARLFTSVDQVGRPTCTDVHA